jgi:hypothetical protein
MLKEQSLFASGPAGTRFRRGANCRSATFLDSSPKKISPPCKSLRRFGAFMCGAKNIPGTKVVVSCNYTRRRADEETKSDSGNSNG